MDETDTSPLDRLPVEVLRLIALSCEHLRDIAAWASTNHLYHEVVNRVLYEYVVSIREWSIVFRAAKTGCIGTLRQWVSIRDPDGAVRAALDIYQSGHGQGMPRYAAGPMDGKMQARHACFWTPLHQAASHGHRETVEFLLDHGSDIDAPSFGLVRHSFRVFHDARDRSSSSAPDCVTLSALHLAIIHGCEEVALLLLQLGADIRVMPLRDGRPSGITAFHLAAAYGMVSVLRVLSDRPDVDINGTDVDGQPPLLYAAENEMGYPALDILKDLGADLDCTMDDGNGSQRPLLLMLIRRIKWKAAVKLIRLGAQTGQGMSRNDFLEECEKAKMSVIYPDTPDLEAWNQLALAPECSTGGTLTSRLRNSHKGVKKYWPFRREVQKG